MDLQYPTQHNVDIIKRLNHLDKLNSKLNLTQKDMPPSHILTKHQKEKIIKCISQDEQRKLITFLNKEVITAEKEIGIKGSRWNLLHVCAKYNASDCMQKLLKNIYQQDKEAYLEIVNSQTIEGYSPLMISVIYQSHNTLALILKLGGADLSQIQSNKMRAYDLALNYKNQRAIQQLIIYENRCKTQLYINQKQLMALEQQKSQPSLCQNFVNYLLDCFLCLKRDAETDQNAVMAKINNIIGLTQADKSNNNTDLVKIGSRKDIEDYQIVWKRLSEIEGQKMTLFDSIKGLDISQNQFTLTNNLILFQLLCERPSIIRKNIVKIQKPKQKNEPNKFMITFYKNFSATTIEVDETVPIVKQRGEIMFLSNKNEIWPMILQKGLAKLYDSYILLNSLNPLEALQEITGFYTKSIPVSLLAKQGSIVSYLHELSLKGYMIMLEANQNTQLNNGSNHNYFSILNYYDKGKHSKVLLNCPGILNKWKETKQNRDLAVIKSHFNKHDQSRIWIDQSKLQSLFKNVLICYSRSNVVRNQLKIKLKAKTKIDRLVDEKCKKYLLNDNKKSIFFKFKIEQQCEEPIGFQLINVKTKKKYELSDVAGWKNEGKEALFHSIESEQCRELTYINQEVGQYMLMYQFIQQKAQKIQKIQLQTNKGIIKLKRDANLSSISQKSQSQRQQSFKKKVRLNLQPINLKQLLLVSWSNESLQAEYVQQQFGTIEWLSYFKNYYINHWNQLLKDSIEERYVYETVNDISILLIYKPHIKKAYLQIESGQMMNWSDSIIQGRVRENQGNSLVQLIVDSKNKNYFYLVVTNISLEQLQKEHLIKFLFQE